MRPRIVMTAILASALSLCTYTGTICKHSEGDEDE
jgi:hypothetical protein